MLRELYEQVYGIANHIESKNPLEIVLVQDNELLVTNDPMTNIIEQYAALDLYGMFGIAFDKFIKLPSYQTKMMIKSANKKREREAHKAQEMEAKSKATKIGT